MNRTQISVVIPTWNGQKTIASCLESLLGQTRPPTEIIVVDNGSTDNTVLIVSHIKKVKLVKLPQNTGVVGGRNRGLSETSPDSSYILFFDHDMEAGPKMLEHLYQTAVKYQAGIVTPKIYYKTIPGLVWSAGTGINLLTGQVLFRNGADRGQFNQEEEVQVAPAAMLINRRVIRSIGGFDPLFVSSWEDTDFCFRAETAGFSTYFSPKAIAYHAILYDPHAEAHRLLDRYGFYIGRNRIIFMKRHGKNFALFLVLFLPVFMSYYLYLAMTHKKISKYMNFLKGVVQGLYISLTSARSIKSSFL